MLQAVAGSVAGELIASSLAYLVRLVFYEQTVKPLRQVSFIFCACKMQEYTGFLRTICQHSLLYASQPVDNHRIIECFGLEGTFRGHLAQSLCNEQGHLSLHQVAQSSVQPDLDCFQGWGIYHLSGQPIPVFHHPHYKKCLLYIWSKSTLF